MDGRTIAAPTGSGAMMNVAVTMMMVSKLTCPIHYQLTKTGKVWYRKIG